MTTIIYKTQQHNFSDLSELNKDTYASVHVCFTCALKTNKDAHVASIGYEDNEQLPVNNCWLCHIPFNLHL